MLLHGYESGHHQTLISYHVECLIYTYDLTVWLLQGLFKSMVCVF